MIKKFLLTILFTLVLSGGAISEIIELKNCKYTDPDAAKRFSINNYIKIDTSENSIFWEWDGGSEKHNYTSGNLDSGFNLKINDNYGYVEYFFDVKEAKISRSVYDISSISKKLKYSEKKSREGSMKCDKANYIANSSSDKNTDITFNIKQKKEQCEAIGFKPETDKFADCVLRLVELDVKQQTQNQIVSAQNSGNDALVKQLERQNNLQSSQALINLGQQLMNPKQYNSNIYMPQTRRCTVSGFGATSVVRCY
jgi:hypothetical protein